MTIRQLLAGRPLAPFCGLLAVLWLSACVTGPAVDNGLDQAALPAKSIEPVKLPGTNALVAGERVDTAISHPAPRTRAAVVPEPAPETPPRPIPDLYQLVGMNRGDLSGLLGKPSLRRSEPPAEVWLYSAAQCVLHVFLYNDAAQGRYLVSHVEVAHRQQRAIHAVASSGDSFRQECFGRVLHSVTAQIQAG